MTNFPLYGVTLIATRFPFVETNLSISISRQQESGEVITTFETLTFTPEQYPPFTMTEADVKQMLATHYQTTVDHIRIMPHVAPTE